MNTIKEFLSSPNLTDVISFALIAVAFLLQLFLKLYVGKTSRLDKMFLEVRTKRVEDLHTRLEAEIADFNDNKARLDKEIAELKNEVKALKKAVKIGFGNEVEDDK